MTSELLLKDREEEFDFGETLAFRILNSSERFKQKYSTPYDAYIQPKQFIKIVRDKILESISASESDFWILIFGYEGSGKSSLSLMLYKEILEALGKKDTFDENIVFLQSEYAKIIFYFIKNSIKKTTLLIDDAHYVFGKYSTLTKETLSVLQLARFVRDQQIVHLLNCQSPTQLYRDIWYERVLEYIFTFKVRKILEDGSTIYRMYACYYSDPFEIKSNPDFVRNVSNWKKIIKNFPPDAITRFDFLFPEYQEEYEKYKKIKLFYKMLYSYFRYRGVVNARDYENILNILNVLATTGDTESLSPTEKKLYNQLLLNNNGQLDKNIESIININKEVIQKRALLLREKSG